jgi:hypothetical protein
MSPEGLDGQEIVHGDWDHITYTPKKPNPGSEEAKKLGCICPILDNEFGEGFGGMFYTVEGCPLHWTTKKDPSAIERSS